MLKTAAVPSSTLRAASRSILPRGEALRVAKASRILVPIQEASETPFQNRLLRLARRLVGTREVPVEALRKGDTFIDMTGRTPEKLLPKGVQYIRPVHDDLRYTDKGSLVRMFRAMGLQDKIPHGPADDLLTLTERAGVNPQNTKAMDSFLRKLIGGDWIAKDTIGGGGIDVYTNARQLARLSPEQLANTIVQERKPIARVSPLIRLVDRRISDLLNRDFYNSMRGTQEVRVHAFQNKVIPYAAIHSGSVSKGLIPFRTARIRKAEKFVQDIMDQMAKKDPSSRQKFFGADVAFTPKGEPFLIELNPRGRFGGSQYASHPLVQNAINAALTGRTPVMQQAERAGKGLAVAGGIAIPSGVLYQNLKEKDRPWYRALQKTGGAGARVLRKTLPAVMTPKAFPQLRDSLKQFASAAGKPAEEAGVKEVFERGMYFALPSAEWDMVGRVGVLRKLFGLKAVRPEHIPFLPAGSVVLDPGAMFSKGSLPKTLHHILPLGGTRAEFDNKLWVAKLLSKAGLSKSQPAYHSEDLLSLFRRSGINRKDPKAVDKLLRETLGGKDWIVKDFVGMSGNGLYTKPAHVAALGEKRLAKALLQERVPLERVSPVLRALDKGVDKVLKLGTPNTLRGTSEYRIPVLFGTVVPYGTTHAGSVVRSHLPVVTERTKTAEKFAQGIIDRLAKHDPRVKQMAFGMDIAFMQNGKPVLMELNPAGRTGYSGFQDYPWIQDAIMSQVQGTVPIVKTMNTAGKVGLGGAAVGGVGLGTAAGIHSHRERERPWWQKVLDRA